VKNLRFCKLVSRQCLRLSNFLFWCKKFPLYFQIFEKMLGFLKQQGVMKARSSILEGLDLSHRMGVWVEILKFYNYARTLKSYAVVGPGRYGRPAGSMLAPKPTTQKSSNTKAGRDLPGPSSQSAHVTLAVPRQRTMSAKPPTSPSQLMEGLHQQLVSLKFHLIVCVFHCSHKCGDD
jgi:hypothetical protein